MHTLSDTVAMIVPCSCLSPRLPLRTSFVFEDGCQCCNEAINRAFGREMVSLFSYIMIKPRRSHSVPDNSCCIFPTIVSSYKVFSHRLYHHVFTFIHPMVMLLLGEGEVQASHHHDDGYLFTIQTTTRAEDEEEARKEGGNGR